MVEIVTTDRIVATTGRAEHVTTLPLQRKVLLLEHLVGLHDPTDKPAPLTAIRNTEQIRSDDHADRAEERDARVSPRQRAGGALEGALEQHQTKAKGGSNKAEG